MDIYLVAEIIGFLAGFILSLSFVPQAIKSIKTKDTKSIALSTYILQIIGITLWFTYGVILQSNPIMFWNGISFFVVGAVLITKIRYG